ncbi:MAG: hypothetical protein RAO94_10510 [Candidatus Stygibacter australis]|nr:hypothetical protein [Candidatus Stygibacter australis]MDP8322770.1 hypothetical protein [Candidatus Stygibacter australis]
MRKLIIFGLLLFLTASAYAFEKGTVNVGGNVSYSSIKANSDADAYTIFLFSSQAGYFVRDNIALDIGFDLSVADYDGSETSLIFDIGSRYFIGDIFYSGFKVMVQTYSGGGFKLSQNFVQLGAGYLVPLVKNVVYLNLDVNYTMGIGDYGGDISGTNEESRLNFGAGIEYFIKK